MMSRPTRARGLKSWYAVRAVFVTGSRPTRARGLKFLRRCGHGGRRLVAPHAGAWIEILSCFTSSSVPSVAPHAGAWIEIVEHGLSGTVLPSRPTRARGLKSNASGKGPGAGLSRPTRARGLKYGHVLHALIECSRAPRGRVD